MSVVLTRAVPDALLRFFQEHPRVTVAFSGGADSSCLLHVAKVCGAHVHAHYVSTEFQPDFALQEAREFCAQQGIPLTVTVLHLLEHEAVAANQSDRCYHCKRIMLEAVQRQAALDASVVVDGSNASDNAQHRPGMRAVQELGVRSPLRDAGVTKKDVRNFSRHWGLSTWNKPSYACLATRFDTGLPLAEVQLRKVERLESELGQIGIADFRVRVKNETAILCITDEQFSLVMDRRKEIYNLLNMDFSSVLLDLHPKQSVSEELDE